MSTPTIRLLGPVTIEGAAGPRPESPARITELIVYLALHPWATPEPLDQAVWGHDTRVTSNCRAHAMNQARRWLGTTRQGRPHVALVAQAGYRLDDEVTNDWQRFRDLVGATPHTASTAQLTSALQLVTGQPLSAVNPVRYLWAEVDRAEMIALVADTALELAERALRQRDNRTATWAAAKGLSAEPIHEGLWRQSLVAAATSGIPNRLQDVTAQLHHVLDPIGDLEQETNHLLHTLQQHENATSLAERGAPHRRIC